MLRSVYLSAAFAALLAWGISAEEVEVLLKPASSSVHSIEDIFITAIVSNPTNQDIRVLAVNNVLDSSPTQSFIVSRDDKEIEFTGISAIFDTGADGAYKVIPAGSSETVNHTGIASLYDFQSAGTGKFRFTPRPLYLAGSNTPMALKMQDVTIDVTQDVLPRSQFDVDKSTPTCANKTQLLFIKRALSEALVLARDTANDIRSRPSSKEFKTYFKTNTMMSVWGRYNKMANDRGTRVVSCNDPSKICQGPRPVIAYVSRAGQPDGNVYTCPRFFTEVNSTPNICETGFNRTTSSDGGVILHELSHANSRSKDLGYGCIVTEGLSPAEQLQNADNFRCMSLAVFYRKNC